MNIKLHTIIMIIAFITMKNFTFTLAKIPPTELGKMKNTIGVVACGCPETGPAVCGSDNTTYTNLCQLQCVKRARNPDLRRVPFKECVRISKVKKVLALTPVSKQKIITGITQGKPRNIKKPFSSKKLQKGNMNKPMNQPMNKTNQSNSPMNKTNKSNTPMNKINKSNSPLNEINKLNLLMNKLSNNIQQNLTTLKKNLQKKGTKQMLNKQAVNFGTKKNYFQDKKQVNKNKVKQNLKKPLKNINNMYSNKILNKQGKPRDKKQQKPSLMNAGVMSNSFQDRNKLFDRNKSINYAMQILHTPTKYVRNKNVMKSLIDEDTSNSVGNSSLIENIYAIKKHVNVVKKLLSTKPPMHKLNSLPNAYLNYEKRFPHRSNADKYGENLHSTKRNNHYRTNNFLFHNMNNMRHQSYLNEYPFHNQFNYRHTYGSPYSPINNRLEPPDIAWYQHGNSFHGRDYNRRYPHFRKNYRYRYNMNNNIYPYNHIHSYNL